MLTISAQEYQRNPGKYNNAAQVQRAAITHYGRELIVLLSPVTFHEMQHYTRDVLPVSALSDEDLADIAAAEPPTGNAYLDRELDQDT